MGPEKSNMTAKNPVPTGNSAVATLSYVKPKLRINIQEVDNGWLMSNDNYPLINLVAKTEKEVLDCVNNIIEAHKTK